MKRNKGEYGYIKYATIRSLIFTVILFAMALGLFFIGYLTLHTKKSLWSVFAVLGILPASKSLVGTIMYCRFGSLTSDQYSRYKSAIGNVQTIFENVLTTNSRSFYLPAISYCERNIIGFYNGTQGDCEEIKEHITHVFQNEGFKDFTIKIFSKEEDYLNRVSELNKMCDENTSNEPMAQFLHIITTVSL